MATQVTFLAEEWTQSAKGDALSTLTRQLAIHLAQRPNLKVSLLIPKCSPEDKQDAGKYNIKVFEPEEQPGLKPVYWLGFPPEGFSTDFIIGHDVKLGWQGNAIKRRYGCKWIHVVHSNAEEMGMYKNLPGAISAAQEEQENQVKLCESANMVITIGPKLEDSLSCSLSFSGKEIFNLTPGIFDEFCNIRKDFQERKTCSLLIFGRGDAEDFELKGFDVAAKAVALNDSTYRLIVVGAPDGRQEKLATKLCSHGIPRSQLIVRRFYKDRKQLANFFAEADLLLMPSGTEAFGLAALEALSAGLPVLVTSNSGLAEALREVPLGSQCIVDSHSEAEWAKKIKEVWKFLKTRQKEAKILCDGYKEVYSWEKQCDALVKKMQSMLSDAASDTKKSLNKAGSSSAQKRRKDAEEDNNGSDTGEENFDNPSSSKRHRACDEMPEKHAFNSCQQPSTSGASVVTTHYMCSVASTPTPAATPLVACPNPTEASQSTIAFKEGKPGDLELDELAGKIGQKWKKLGIRLGISNDVLDEIAANANDKPLQMLLRWRDTTSSATPYRELYDALCHSRVGLNNLAKEFCCKATT